MMSRKDKEKKGRKEGRTLGRFFSKLTTSSSSSYNKNKQATEKGKKKKKKKKKIDGYILLIPSKLKKWSRTQTKLAHKELETKAPENQSFEPNNNDVIKMHEEIKTWDSVSF